MSAPERRPWRIAVVAAVAAVAAVLTGCTGIPTSGQVIAGPEVGFAEADFVLNPAGPQEGAAPRDILAGFMTAVRAPQGGYQVAREFLTPSLATEWDPDAAALVRASAPVFLDVIATDDVARVDYVVETIGEVDQRGRYRETLPTSRTLEFGFTLVDGQWRISSAPDGVVLSQAGFGSAFTETALYFLDPTGRFLVPDVRWFADRSTTPNKAVQELLAGPTEWLQRVVITEFPAGTTIGAQSVEIRSGQALVDLSAEAASATPAARSAMWSQLAATLGVADVRLSAAGVPLEVTAAVPAPVVDPQPSGTVVVGTGDAFGFGTDDGVVEIDGISATIVADGALGVTLAHDQLSAAYLADDGTVRFVAAGDAAPIVLDTRAGLIVPSLDPYGFVWTATAGAGDAGIAAISTQGDAIPLVPDGLPTELSVVSIDVSRDGTRLLVAASSALGPRLLVYGIARTDGVPGQLTGPLELVAPTGSIIDAAWVDDRSVVVLGGLNAIRAVHVPLGGPSAELGGVAGAVAIAGGRGGVSGIRALAGDRILAASSGGWSDTGIVAVLLGIQQ